MQLLSLAPLHYDSKFVVEPAEEDKFALFRVAAFTPKATAVARPVYKELAPTFIPAAAVPNATE